MIFLVVRHGCESWAIIKPEPWRIVVLDKTVESPLECEEIKPINLKEINPEHSLEGLMLELKLQYFGHLMQRVESLEKTLMLGKSEGNRRGGQQKMWWLDSISNSMDMNLSKLWEIVRDRESWRVAVSGVSKSWTWVSNRTTTNQIKLVQLHRSHTCEARYSAHGCHLLAGLQLFLGCFMSLCDSLRCCRFPEGSCAFLLNLFEWSSVKLPASWLFHYFAGRPSWLLSTIAGHMYLHFSVSSTHLVGISLHQLSLQGSPGTLEWVTYPFSSRSSWPRNQTRVYCITGRFFTNWDVREALLTTSVSLVAQLVKNLPSLQETWVWSLGWEDLLEKGKATHCCIMAWRIPWTVWSMGSQRVGHDWSAFTFQSPSSS